ncbi:MAG: hypothetical protein IJP89_00140 [Synergistaceae bacterium]|nr:hypothetical protein [Synergistaceae bacterium]
MTKIGSVRISVPCFMCGVEVEYSVPKRATAIESLILDIASQLAVKPGYSAMSVSEICGLFMIDDADSLIRPLLNDLKGRGVISADNLSDDTDMKTYSAGGIKLTQEGARLQRDGLIPGIPQKLTVKAMYDSAAGKWGANIPENRQPPSDVHMITEHEAENFIIPLPALNIIPSLSPSIPKGAFIHSVKVRRDETRWVCEAYDIELSRDGNILLKGIPAQFLRKDMLPPSTFEIESVMELESVDWENDRVFTAENLKHEGALMLNEAVCFVDARFARNFGGHSGKGVMIAFNAPEFSQGNGGREISVPFSPFADESVIMCSEKRIIRAGRVSLHVGAEIADTVICVAAGDSRARVAFRSAQSAVSAMLKSEGAKNPFKGGKKN